MTKAEQLKLDIKDPKNWKRTCAKQYEVYICMPIPGTETKNALENCKYTTDQKRPFIISGTLGETWTIDANKFVSKYGVRKAGGLAPVDIEKYNQAYLNGQTVDWRKFEARSGQGRAWAFFLDMDKYGNAVKNFPVKTSWGDTLTANRTGIPHGHGDFLLCEDVNGQPDFNNMWVVNGKVFVRTYNLQQFKNLRINQDEFVTPRPRPCKVIHDHDDYDNSDTVISYVHGVDAGALEFQEQNYGNSRFTYDRVQQLIIATKGNFGVKTMYSWNKDFEDLGFRGQAIGYLYRDYYHILGIVTCGDMVKLVNPAELTGKMLGYDFKNRVQSKDYRINIGNIDDMDSSIERQQMRKLTQKIDSVLKGNSLSETEAKLVNTFIDIAYEKENFEQYQKAIAKYKIPDWIVYSCEFGLDWTIDYDYDIEYDKKHHIENKNGAAEPVWQTFLNQLKQSYIKERVFFVEVFDRDLPGFKDCKVAFVKCWNEQVLGLVMHANGMIDITDPLELCRKIESYGQKEITSHFEQASIDNIDMIFKYIEYCFDNKVINRSEWESVSCYFKAWQSLDAIERQTMRLNGDIKNTAVYDRTFKRINFYG